ncbi:uncharacterized protein LOC132618652 [Lycium barbarum]|uniref:uncharacterized protein LOC132618652 n=1 Tax=Lycium barbarum TaxID=112863 RepID=UPI00293E7975|nr:uncharacterized protein LOC132618652 [Lycium barbarum]
MVESNGSGAGSSTEVLRMLETLAKRVDSTEKRVETYNSRVDQIPGAPPILKGPDSKRYIQRPFPPSAAPKLIPKRFKMPDIQKYDGTTDPQEHVTSYTCVIKGNDVEEDEIESVLLKKFGKTLSKGALTWYDHLPEHSITSFEMLADAFIKAHAGAKKVQARKADIFCIAQRDDELLHEFVNRFQRERMELPPVPEEWAAQAFTKGLNPRSSTASFKLKENLLEYEAVCENALVRIAAQKQIMERYYNRRTNFRHFQVGDLVLWKVTLNTKNPNEGKLGLNWEGPYKIIEVTGKGSYQLESMDGQRLRNNWNVAHLKRYYC